jgi:hypothetical protein
MHKNDLLSTSFEKQLLTIYSTKLLLPSEERCESHRGNAGKLKI